MYIYLALKVLQSGSCFHPSVKITLYIIVELRKIYKVGDDISIP